MNRNKYPSVGRVFLGRLLVEPGVNQQPPVQDEVVQAVLGMNQKHILFPCPGIFQPLLCPKIFPSYHPSTSFTSFAAHPICRTGESS